MTQPDATAPFSDLYGRLVQEFTHEVGERPSAYEGAQQHIREEIVRCLWFGSHFNPDELTTDDGRRIEVLSPGWWNVEGGPDFIRAEFLLEGAGRIAGDVEVHTHASSWYGHGHDAQPEYNTVTLHVVMWNDVPDRAIQLQSGRAIPQLTLCKFVEEEVGELVEVVDMEKAATRGGAAAAAGGRFCGRAMADGALKPEWLGRLLDCAGDHRVLTKADRMQRLLEKQPREQVLYEALAEALGYKNNRMPFLQLAGALPLTALREIVPADAPSEQRREALEAAFYGVGGFLEQGARSHCDEETAAYVQRLRELWDHMPSKVKGARMTPGHWTFAGTRPVNYPTRRIAALCCIYADHLGEGLFGHLVRLVMGAQKRPRRGLDAAVRHALTDFFLGLRHPYWSQRSTLGGRRHAGALRLVGAERAAAVTVDVLLPLLLAHARSENREELISRLHLLWERLPSRAPNSVVRRMCQVLFPASVPSRTVINSARRQQGLHQLYKDSCGARDGCPSCVLYLAHSAGKVLREV